LPSKKESPPKPPEELIEDLTTEVEELGEAEKVAEKIGERLDIPKEEVEEIGRKYGFFEKFSNVGNSIKNTANAAIEKIKGLFGKKEMAEETETAVDISPEKKEEIKEKIGAAKTRAELFKAISKNSDTPPEKLLEMVQSGADKYGLPQNQIEDLKNFVEQYSEKHKAVREVRKQFKDDKLLFNACFGFLPKGKVEALEGSMSLYFRCKNKADYTDIIMRQVGIYIREERGKTLCKLSGAVALKEFSAIPQLRGSLIIENSAGISGFKFKFEINEARRHEEQHLLKKLFKEPFSRSDAREKMNNAKSAEEKEKMLEPYLRAFKEAAVDRNAKDEILANIKEGESSSKIYSTLTKKLGEGGLYDYLELQRNAMEEDFQQRGISKEKYLPLAKKIFHDEYKVSLKESLNAVEELKKMGKDTDEIVATLITEPLEKWQEFVKDLRIYEK